jgi:hypothetical protein
MVADGRAGVAGSVRFRRRAPVGRLPGWPLCARERQSDTGQLDCWVPACRAADASLVPRLGCGGSGYPVRRDGVEVSAVGGDVLVGVLLEKSCLKRAGFGSSDASGSLAPAPRRPLLVHLNSLVGAPGHARVPGEAGARALAGRHQTVSGGVAMHTQARAGDEDVPELRRSGSAEQKGNQIGRITPAGVITDAGPTAGIDARWQPPSELRRDRRRDKESTMRSRHSRRRWMVQRPNVPGWDRSLRAVTELAVAAAPGLTSGPSPELTHEYLLLEAPYAARVPASEPAVAADPVPSREPEPVQSPVLRTRRRVPSAHPFANFATSVAF